MNPTITLRSQHHRSEKSDVDKGSQALLRSKSKALQFIKSKLLKKKNRVFLAGIVVISILLSSLTSYISNILAQKLLHNKVEATITPSLSLSERNPDVHPEDYYISLGELTNSKEEQEGIAKRYQGNLLKTESQPDTPSTLLPYYFGEKDESVEIILKSRDGLQRFVLTKSDLTLTLSEKKRDQVEFEPRVSSTPTFQYRDENSEWQEYVVLHGIEFEIIDQAENYIVIRQLFSLATRENSDIHIQGSTTLKLGFDGENYINKITFELQDNSNVSRVLWQNQLTDELWNLRDSDFEDSKTGATYGNVHINWSDFIQQNNNERIPVEKKETKTDGQEAANDEPTEEPETSSTPEETEAEQEEDVEEGTSVEELNNDNPDNPNDSLEVDQEQTSEEGESEDSEVDETDVNEQDEIEMVTEDEEEVKEEEPNLRDNNQNLDEDLQVAEDNSPEDYWQIHAENKVVICFYPQGVQGGLFVDPTLSLSTTSSTVQVDVPNRYRATMTTNQTTDYLVILDRYEDDATPDKISEQSGPLIYESTVSYSLRRDSNRKTTLLESSPTRVRIRVEGRFMNEAGSNYLNDTADDILVLEDYTFTTEGYWVENITDFRSTGIALDNTFWYDGYRPFGPNFNYTDGYHSEEIVYGNGQTEGTLSIDGTFSNSNTYVVCQGNSGYQDIITGMMDSSWANYGTDWAYRVDYDSETDIFLPRVQGVTLVGEYRARWFSNTFPQADMDSKTKREGYINDLRNPDIPDVSIGSEWNDAPASPGIELNESASDYLNCGTDSSLQPSGSFTIEAWVNLDDLSTDHAIVTKGNGANDQGYLFRVNTSGQLVVYTGNGSWNGRTSTITVDTGIWQHIAYVHDSGNYEIVHVNGVREALASTPNATYTGTDPLEIGVYDEASWPLDGRIDEVRVWSEARTEAEIRDNMYKQLAGSEANLAGYWRLNENNGTDTHDETVNDNDCSFVGSPDWRTGLMPDYYNEAEGAYTVDMSSNVAKVDLDGEANTSTTLSAGVSAGASSVSLTDSSGFPSPSGVAYIYADKISYTGNSSNTLSGIPSSGELSILTHSGGDVISLTNRHNPVLKLRNWRDIAEPSDISLEDNMLLSGTDYNIDIKPFSTGYFAQDLLWHSTLEDEGAVECPDVGGVATVAATATFTTGRYGNGVLCNANSENVVIPMSGNVNSTVGTIEFWYRRTATISQYSNFFESSKGIDGFSLERNNSDTDINLYIESTAVAWSGVRNVFDGEWHHIRLTYDTSTPSHHLYIDGFDEGENTTSVSSVDVNYNLIVGDQNGSQPINGIIDEFRIYDTVVGPDPIAKGGDTSDGDEYLGDPDTDYTFDFNADDDNNRGEYVWIGSDSRFQGVNMDLATDGSGSSLDYEWEYWSRAGSSVPTFPFADDSALEGLWYLEEAGDATRLDETSNNNDLVESDSDTVVQTSDRREGSYSADFELGDTEHLYISDGSQTDLDIVGNLTITAWIKPETLTAATFYNIVTKYDTTGSYKSYNFAAYGTALDGGLSSDCSAETGDVYTATSVLSVGTWSHIALVYNSSDIRIYVDGALSQNGINNPSTYSGGICDSDADFSIGALGNPTNYFDGIIDEVAVFSRDLSANEIRKIYDARVNTYAWRDLSVTDTDSGASSFTADGNFYFIAPSTWNPYSVNGSTDLYYIRGHLNSGTYSVDPTEDTIKTDILTFQYLSNISNLDQTFAIPAVVPPLNRLMRHGKWFNSSGERQPFTF